MKSKLFFLVFLMLMAFSLVVTAQDSLKLRQNFIALSVGGNFALGKFGEDATLTSRSVGFATYGFQYQVEYAGFWSRHAGFGIEAGGFSNSVNQDAFNQDFKSNFFLRYGGVSVVVSDVDPWKVNYLLTGPYLTLPFKDVMVDLKALGGVFLVTSPAFTYTTTSAQKAGDKSTTNFGFGLGSNIRLKLSSSAQLKFGIEYLQTYADASYNSNATTNPYPMTGGGIQSIATLNLSWGVAFVMGKAK